MKIRRILLPAFAALMALPAQAQQAGQPAPFYFGADLSYVNEMEDCGAIYRKDGQARDPYGLFAEMGTNQVRVRIWHDPEWTNYSDLDDARETIRRARAAGMEVLLDFHYSDDWADGDKQIVPKAWRSIRDDTPALAQAVYDYTFSTLRALDAEGLTPDQVQVGNETNPEMMGEADWKTTRPGINWERNAALFNAGIKAVRDAGAQSSIQPLVMLHIAQPENVEPWFADAWKHGVTDFDLIGVSYYRKWSTQGLDGLEQTITRLRHRYPAEVVVVETAYPFTTDSADNSPNLLGQDSLLPGDPATYEGQRQYMHDLTQRVKFAGGVGVVYWEPAWVSTPCSTRWGQGSNWENATYFDWRRGNEPTPAAYFAKETYQEPAPIQITVRRPQGATGPLWLWGDFLGANDMIVRLSPDASDPTLYRYTTTIRPESTVRFQVYDQRPFTKGLIQSGDLIQATVGNEGLDAAYDIAR